MPSTTTVTNRRSGAVIVSECAIADSFWTRLRGLLGRRSLEPGEGLLIERTSSVHMLGMRFAIDAVFLDGDRRVLKVAADLRPWRLAGCRGAKSVLELPAGVAHDAALVGDQLLVAGEVQTPDHEPKGPGKP